MGSKPRLLHRKYLGKSFIPGMPPVAAFSNLRLGEIKGNHDSPLVRDIVERVIRESQSALGRITRVEFMHGPHPDSPHLVLSGAVLFLEDKRPLVHLTHAELGYDSPGLSLSRQVLEQLELPGWMIDEIIVALDGVRYRPEPYAVVVKLDDSGWAWHRVV